MRKHRLYGVVIAVLLGIGVLTPRPGFAHPAAGTDLNRSGQLTVQLISPGIPGAQPGTKLHQDTSTRVPGRDVPALDASLSAASAGTPVASTLVALLLYVPPPPPAPKPRALAPVHLAPAPATAPAAPSAGVWARLRRCESGGNYADDTGNGYYGAYQFALGTWRSLGLSGLPSDAPPGVQDQAAQELQARRGWGQWPACSRTLGLT